MRPGSQLAFKLIPEVLDEVQIRALCRPVKFLHIIFDKTITIWTSLSACGALS
uniref:Uncharacterized protein n=1 Tax=Anguilla anguilla TaxID=7936 RepID=A0A0E9XE90_ANGAN